VGFSTQKLAAREKQHRALARTGGGHHFHRALRKYGDENFVFEILFDFLDDAELAKVYEWEMISKYKPEYNLTAGGEGGTMHPETRKKIGAANSRRVFTDEMRKRLGDAARGTTRSAETKQKMREAGLGRKHTAETLKKMSDVQRGHPTSEAARAKMRIARQKRESPSKGKKWSAESKARLSAARKGAVSSERKTAANAANALKAHAACKKPVICLTDGRIFDGAADADRFYGFKKATVSNLISGQLKPRELVFAFYKVQE
jgi:group I intron endonuclease